MVVQVPPLVTHYTVLDVPVNAAAAKIKAAFRAKARSAHPDMGGSAGQFQRIEAAYAVLSVPASRVTYDQQLLKLERLRSLYQASSDEVAAAREAAERARAAAREAAEYTQAQAWARAERAQAAAQAAERAQRERQVAAERQLADLARQAELARALRAHARRRRIQVWLFVPLEVALLTGGALLRFTGVTAQWFHPRMGAPLFFGDWYGVPTFRTDGIGTGVVMGAVFIFALMTVLVVRARLAPRPVPESLIVLLYPPALLSVIEFVAYPATRLIPLLLLPAGVYLAWMLVLRWLGAPQEPAEWRTLRGYLRGSAARRRGVLAGRVRAEVAGGRKRGSSVHAKFRSWLPWNMPR